MEYARVLRCGCKYLISCWTFFEVKLYLQHKSNKLTNMYTSVVLDCVKIDTHTYLHAPTYELTLECLGRKSRREKVKSEQLSSILL